MMDYPDPHELREFARGPMPFHDIRAADLELLSDNRLRYGVESAEYVYHPTYILVETAPEEWENIDDVSGFDMDHEDAFNRAIDLQIEEDFICATEFVTDSEGEPAQFDAYWILESVTIENPRLYAD